VGESFKRDLFGPSEGGEEGPYNRGCIDRKREGDQPHFYAKYLGILDEETRQELTKRQWLEYHKNKEEFEGRNGKK